MSLNKRIGLGFFLLFMVGLYIADRFYFAKKPIIYANFGISIPAGYTTHGIDVSRYQKDIDWDLVSKMTDQGQHLSFAIVKATEGTNLVDNYFSCNWKALQNKSLIRGAYLYFHANKSGKSQAEYFISKVTLEEGDLPPIVDIEERFGMPDVKLRNALQECLNTLEKKYKHKPLIYSNVDFYEKRLGTQFDEYPYWAAHYEQVSEPRIQRKWLMWQHNCKGHVNGIAADVDFNVVNGSLFTLSDLCL
jgi:lysozyme